MREIHTDIITESVSSLCREACLSLPDDIMQCLTEAFEREKSHLGREAIAAILENAAISRNEGIPLCQDCGLTVIFAEVGQDLHICGGDFSKALAEGVRRGYIEGYLRKSVVKDPAFSRINTGDNTPPVIYMDIVPGDRLRLSIAPKGGGSENMSALAMLKPSSGVEAIADFVVHTVRKAGSNPCPPIIAGVGIGGSADRAMVLAKKSLFRKAGMPNEIPEYAMLERTILDAINASGIGPQGYGGNVTALAVHIETFPCHIASLPVAVNLQCHSARHREAVL